MRRRLVLASVCALVLLAGCNGAGGGSSAPNGGNVGVAVGGAQDATTFRKSVENGAVPRPQSITYAGLYHDYYFETNAGRECAARFCPSYARAVSPDPLSNETEYYLTVGLNSGLSERNFSRPDLNLVVVLDTSGSMDDAFERGGEGIDARQAKIDAAADAVGTLTRQLDEGDRVGVVAFDRQARTVQELTAVGELDRDGLREEIQSIHADGGTDLSAGMAAARSMVDPMAEANGSAETRIVYVTDAKPNDGATSVRALRDRLESDAGAGIHSTFVGVGVDFNTELVDAISSVEGGNYYTVDSPGAFSERMSTGFRNMVTPLAYDLSLSVEGDGYRIERVYGTPSDGDTSTVLHADTLFPSRKQGNRTEGGVILVELTRTGEDPSLAVTTQYRTPAGETKRAERRVAFRARDAPYYETSGVRKAVALTRYGTLMRNWVDSEYSRRGDGAEEPAAGIEPGGVSQWDDRPMELRVSGAYADRISRFREYYASEVDAIGDASMQRELTVLDTLAEGGSVTELDRRVTEGGRAPIPDPTARTGLLAPVSLLDVLSFAVTVAVAVYGLKKQKRGL